MVKVILEMLQILFDDIQRRKEEFRTSMDDNIWFMRDSCLFHCVDFKKTIIFEKFFKFHIQHVPFNDYYQQGYHIDMSKLLHYIIAQYPSLEKLIKKQVDVINDGYVPGNYWVDINEINEE